MRPGWFHSPRLQTGVYLIWVFIMIPVLAGLLAFAADIGLFQNDKSTSQTVADAAAQAGINVVRRVFYTPTATLSATVKAGHVRTAVLGAANAAGFANSDVTITYCPRSSELGDVSGTGPCWRLGNTNNRVASPSSTYPMATEAVGGAEADTAAYVHVALTKSTTSYFARFLRVMNFPSVSVSAMTRAKERPMSCPGTYITPDGGPKGLDIKSSTLTVNSGGILVDLDHNNALAGTSGTVTADWIRVAGGQGNPNVLYVCRLKPSPCPALNQPLEPALRPVIDYPSVNCNDYSCDQSRGRNPNGCDFAVDKVYVNKRVTSSNVTLRAGTYCGGLQIDHASNVILARDGATLVYRFVEKTNGNGTDGKLTIISSSVTTLNSPGDGVILLSETATHGDNYAVDLESSTLTGYARIYAEGLQLTSSNLSMDNNLTGVVGTLCGAPLELTTGLVQ